MYNKLPTYELVNIIGNSYQNRLISTHVFCKCSDVHPTKVGTCIYDADNRAEREEMFLCDYLVPLYTSDSITECENLLKYNLCQAMVKIPEILRYLSVHEFYMIIDENILIGENNEY